MNKFSKYSFIIYIIVGILILLFIGYKVYESQKVSFETSVVKIINKPKPAEKPITFMIGGDAMLGRAVAWKFKNEVTQVFEKLGPNYFSSNTVGIINLERPISAEEFTANPTPDNLIFNFPPPTIDALKYLGVNAVSLANNHSNNQGPKGFTNTVTMLTDKKITPIGSETNFNESSIKTFDKITVICVNLFAHDYDLTETIKTEKAKSQYVLISPHWGNEYQETHSKTQENYAHNWIDAGADVVIGSHPHVVQDAQIYKNKPIFYSLGNLVFDQSFSTETQRGLILKGEITDKNIKIEILPTKISNYQVELLDGIEKDNTLSKLKSTLGENYLINNILTLPNH